MLRTLFVRADGSRQAFSSVVSAELLSKRLSGSKRYGPGYELEDKKGISCC
jgi:hypothetical protein